MTSGAFGGMAANEGPVPVRTLAHAARLMRGIITKLDALGIPVLLGVLAVGRASSAEPDPSPPNTNDQLSAACPDGHIVRVTDTETQEKMDLACEDVRGMASTEALSGPEQVGEAQERWSPLGILCSVAVGFAVTYGCDRSQLDWRACAGLGVGALACDFI